MNAEFITQEVMPAGTYYVGDICYVFSNENWRKIIPTNKNSQGLHTTPNGEICFIAETNGDGIYVSEDNELFCVDSGTLGVIKINHTESLNIFDNKM